MPHEIAMTDEETDETDADEVDDHLADVEDGAGCAEIWEHLAKRRGADDD